MRFWEQMCLLVTGLELKSPFLLDIFAFFCAGKKGEWESSRVIPRPSWTLNRWVDFYVSLFVREIKRVGRTRVWLVSSWTCGVIEFKKVSCVVRSLRTGRYRENSSCNSRSIWHCGDVFSVQRVSLGLHLNCVVRHCVRWTFLVF